MGPYTITPQDPVAPGRRWVPTFEVETQSIEVGCTVQISDPAYMTPEPDSDTGWVVEEFYGREGLVLDGDGYEEQDDGVWVVQVDGDTNYIHENWLTRVVTPDAQPF